MSKIKISSNRSFGLVFFVVFLVVAFWNFDGNFNKIRILPLLISLSFLILGLMNSKFLNPLNKLWSKFGILLGIIISPIVMAIIFFIIVTPIGIIMRSMGKDLLRKKFEKNLNTYWIKKDKSYASMKRQF